jgi:hypothetical protein
MYAPEAVLHVGGLSAAELALFERKGWIGGYPLLAPSGIAELRRGSRGAARHFQRKGLAQLADDDAVFERRP